MGWILWTVILVIVGAFGVGYFLFTARRADRGLGLAAAGLAIVVWICVTAIYCIHSVGQREVGLVQSASGAITGTKETGWVMTAPWSSIKKENIGLQNEQFTLGVENSAVSRDQQDIYADLAINYQIGVKNVEDLWKNVGPNWKSIVVDARVLQVFKEVTSAYSAQEIATKRPELRRKSKERLTDELAKYDIQVVDFFVTNLNYTNTYKKAIDDKNVQVQQALQAEAKVRQSRAEANQKVATASGEARSTLLQAEADAKSLRLKGRAIHDNPDVLRLEAIDKLNPNAQVVICTGTTCPSFLPGSFGSATTGGTTTGNQGNQGTP